MTTVREVFDSMAYGPAPEADKPAREWLAKYRSTFGHYIGGEWTTPAATFDVNDPSTNTRLAGVSQGS